MNTSERIGRDFQRLLFLCAVRHQSFAAQITDTQTRFSMLCVTERGTGFDWQNKHPVRMLVASGGRHGLEAY